MVDAMWDELATLLKTQRAVVLGKTNRAAWARELGLTSDRVMASLEGAERDNYADSTLLSIMRWYELSPEVLAGVLGARWPGQYEHPVNPGFEAGQVPGGHDTLADIQERVGERSGRNILRIRREGLTIEVPFVDIEDRDRIIAEVLGNNRGDSADEGLDLPDDH